jgi:hypothetical protein
MRIFNLENIAKAFGKRMQSSITYASSQAVHAANLIQKITPELGRKTKANTPPQNARICGQAMKIRKAIRSFLRRKSRAILFVYFGALIFFLFGDGVMREAAFWICVVSSLSYAASSLPNVKDEPRLRLARLLRSRRRDRRRRWLWRLVRLFSFS